jgi:hypothetical protein
MGNRFAPDHLTFVGLIASVGQHPGNQRTALNAGFRRQTACHKNHRHGRAAHMAEAPTFPGLMLC